jgi:threonine dehydrogenase-like Zn-dependent dehydrogenase
MKAVTWQGKRDVRVETVPDPVIQEPTDAVIRITSTGLCGSDLHLYEVLTPFMTPGDILGHEPMGIVEEVGAAVPDLAAGDRVVVPFQIACGACWMCLTGLPTQCETTQCTGEGMGAALFGYTRLYGAVPGAQAEYLRVPQAQFGPIKVPQGPSDDRFLYLSDVLPTAWQAVEYAHIPPGGSVAVLGLGPIGDMACRVALERGAEQVFGIDLVPERLRRARERGVETFDLRDYEDEKDLVAAVQDRTAGRGPDSVIDAVGTEAHGSAAARLAQNATGLLPRAIGSRLTERFGVDRLAAVYTAIDLVRRRQGRPAAPAHPLRQAGPAAHGPGQRPYLERRDPAPAHGRRPPGRRRLRHPPGAAHRRPARLRDVPAQGGRGGEGDHGALSA